MEIENQNGIKFKINEKDHTASVSKFPTNAKSLIIPRFIEYQNQIYNITSIGEYAFLNCKVESLLFPPDSEVTAFERLSFMCGDIKKLQIPAKLNYISHQCFSNNENLTDIEVSPQNRFFTYYQNKYLLFKSDENGDFDVILFANPELQEAIIPAQIRIIENESFSVCTNLKSFKLSKNTKIERIENIFNPFNYLIKELEIPPSLNYIDPYNFPSLNNLKTIKISPKNQKYSLFDNKFLLIKSNKNNQEYYKLVACLPSFDHIEIPKHIKKLVNMLF